MDMTSATMQWYVLHLLLLLLLWPRVARSQQMQQYCGFTPEHTMCRTTGIGPNCGHVQEVHPRGVSEFDAAAIVASHNRYRAQVALGRETRGAPGPQPEAAGMLEMIWDGELALIAQRHADQCVFEHDCGDCRRVARFGVGQNLYVQFSSSADPTISWDLAIQNWYDEVALMPSSTVTSYNFNPSTGHYTQLVWGSTSLVGCGFTMYREGGWYKKLYTCNYGPAGNMMFAAMYQTGPACSACPQGTSCSLSYNGLCASHTDPKGIEIGGLAENPRGIVEEESTENRDPYIRIFNWLNSIAAASAGNSQYLTGFATENQPMTILHNQPNTPSLNTMQAPTTIQIASTAQASSNKQTNSLRSLTSLPPHPATLALQRQGQRSRSRQLQLAEQQQAGQRGVDGQRAAVREQASLSSVDSRILQFLPAAGTLNKFLVNTGQDSQIIKMDSLASVRDVLNTLPAGSSPLVFFRSNMGTLRQLSNRGLLAAPNANDQSRPRTIRSAKSPALRPLDDTEVLNLLTSTGEKHALLLSRTALVDGLDSAAGAGATSGDPGQGVRA